MLYSTVQSYSLLLSAPDLVLFSTDESYSLLTLCVVSCVDTVLCSLDVSETLSRRLRPEAMRIRAPMPERLSRKRIGKDLNFVAGPRKFRRAYLGAEPQISRSLRHFDTRCAKKIKV